MTDDDLRALLVEMFGQPRKVTLWREALRRRALSRAAKAAWAKVDRPPPMTATEKTRAYRQRKREAARSEREAKQRAKEERAAARSVEKADRLIRREYVETKRAKRLERRAAKAITRSCPELRLRAAASRGEVVLYDPRSGFHLRSADAFSGDERSSSEGRDDG